MAYTEVITLQNIIQSKSDSGDLVDKLISEKGVFAEARSIGMKEFYQAQAAGGLKPEHTFIIADYFDYEDEQDVVWNGKRYKVLKTYRRSESTALEITVYSVSSKGGIPNAAT